MTDTNCNSGELNAESGGQSPSAGSDSSNVLAQISGELLLRQARFNDAMRAIDSFHDRLQRIGTTMTVPKRLELHHLEVALNEVREANLEYLFSVADHFGYPDDTKVGLEAAKAAWAMICAIDHTEAAKVRQLLEPMLRGQRGEFPVIDDIIYLEDFCRVITGLPQCYGSLWYVELGAANCLVPYPIDDIINVDKRRAEVGAHETLAQLGLRLAAEDEFDTPIPHLPLAYVLGISKPAKQDQ